MTCCILCLDHSLSFAVLCSKLCINKNGQLRNDCLLSIHIIHDKGKNNISSLKFVYESC